MSASTISDASSVPGVPLVVQLGFAGSRVLFDPKAPVAAPEFNDAVQQHLTERLRGLRGELGLTDRHFFCGLSQLAIGADTLFTRACQELHWPQRLLLPQQREDYLDAVGSKGTPDFDPQQKEVARGLFDSPHIIQERVVGESSDRRTRFQEVNLELVRISDVLVCVVDPTDAAQPGGTRELIEDGDRRKRPTLEIPVSVGPDGRPSFGESLWRHLEEFRPPSLPEQLSDLQTKLVGIPTAAEYCQPLKDFASHMSGSKQNLFRISALVIIGTHIVATGCAVIALQMQGKAALPWLLGGELLLLAVGFRTHRALHRSHPVRVWAMARLVAEIARSGQALSMVPGYLSHLFSLPLPTPLRPLLRTLNVLHLRETRRLPPDLWQDRRRSYVETRLNDPKSGQIPYYRDKWTHAKNWHAVARYAFLAGSGLAILASAGELLLWILERWHVLAKHDERISAVLGTLAIVMPVIAVAALSLAASFDVEARVHTYDEMLKSLKKQKEHLNEAASERAFSSLALETEAHLLGETVIWYSRRAFTGVT